MVMMMMIMRMCAGPSVPRGRYDLAIAEAECLLESLGLTLGVPGLPRLSTSASGRASEDNGRHASF
jgi:hypothetical protein